MMKKAIKHALAIVLIAGFAFLGLGSMGSSPSSYTSAASNIYSGTTEAGLIYTFYNYSSYTVTISDDTGSATIAPGGTASARFNKNASISSVNYSPYDKVSASQSGTTFTFRDR